MKLWNNFHICRDITEDEIVFKKEKDFLEINKISTIKLKKDHVYERNIIKTKQNKIK